MRPTPSPLATLLALGLSTLTPAYDLDLAQLLDLAAGVPANGSKSPSPAPAALPQRALRVLASAQQRHDYRDCGRPARRTWSNSGTARAWSTR